MGVLALILGIVGGLCMIMGILTAVGVAPVLVAGGTALSPIACTTMAWGGLAALLLLGCIAALIARSGYE